MKQLLISSLLLFGCCTQQAQPEKLHRYRVEITFCPDDESCFGGYQTVDDIFAARAPSMADTKKITDKWGTYQYYTDGITQIRQICNLRTIDSIFTSNDVPDTMLNNDWCYVIQERNYQLRFVSKKKWDE